MKNVYQCYDMWRWWRPWRLLVTDTESPNCHVESDHPTYVPICRAQAAFQSVSQSCRHAIAGDDELTALWFVLKELPREFTASRR